MQHSWQLIQELLEEVKIRDCELQQLERENEELYKTFSALDHNYKLQDYAFPNAGRGRK